MDYTLIIGLVLVVAGLIGVCSQIDPQEMAERHEAYLDGYRVGYRGEHLGFLLGDHQEAFKAGWADGKARRTKDACRG